MQPRDALKAPALRAPYLLPLRSKPRWHRAHWQAPLPAFHHRSCNRADREPSPRSRRHQMRLRAQSSQHNEAGSLAYPVKESDELANIDGLDRTARGNGELLDHCRMRDLVMRTTAARWGACDAMLAANSFHIAHCPSRRRIGPHCFEAIIH